MCGTNRQIFPLESTHHSYKSFLMSNGLKHHQSQQASPSIFQSSSSLNVVLSVIFIFLLSGLFHTVIIWWEFSVVNNNKGECSGRAAIHAQYKQVLNDEARAAYVVDRERGPFDIIIALSHSPPPLLLIITLFFSL